MSAQCSSHPAMMEADGRSAPNEGCAHRPHHPHRTASEPISNACMHIHKFVVIIKIMIIVMFILCCNVYFFCACHERATRERTLRRNAMRDSLDGWTDHATDCKFECAGRERSQRQTAGATIHRIHPILVIHPAVGISITRRTKRTSWNRWLRAGCGSGLTLGRLKWIQRSLLKSVLNHLSVSPSLTHTHTYTYSPCDCDEFPCRKWKKGLKKRKGLSAV